MAHAGREVSRTRQFIACVSNSARELWRLCVSGSTVRLRIMKLRSSVVIFGSSSGRLTPMIEYTTTQMKLSAPNTRNIRCHPLAAMMAGEMSSAEIVPKSEPLATSDTRRLRSCTGYHAPAIWCIQGNRIPSPSPIPALVKNRHVRHLATTTVDTSCNIDAKETMSSELYPSHRPPICVATYKQRQTTTPVSSTTLAPNLVAKYPPESTATAESL